MYGFPSSRKLKSGLLLLKGIVVLSCRMMLPARRPGAANRVMSFIFWAEDDKENKNNIIKMIRVPALIFPDENMLYDILKPVKKCKISKAKTGEKNTKILPFSNKGNPICV